MDRGGKSIQINEVMLVTVRAAAHPVQTRDAIKNGDFWHGILSSQESRDTTHKDGHYRKNLFDFWQSKNLLKFYVAPFTFLQQNNTCCPAATVLTFLEDDGTKESFAKQCDNMAVVCNSFSQGVEKTHRCLHDNFTSGNKMKLWAVWKQTKSCIPWAGQK